MVSWFDFVGIIGVSFILLAYFLIQTERVKSNQIIYPVFNLIGAGLIMVSLIKNWNLPSFLIEVVWVMISMYGIIKIIIKKNRG